MTGQELGMKLATIDTVRVQADIRRLVQLIPLHHLMAIGFMLIAWSLASFSNEGLLYWFKERTGIQNDLMIILFTLSSFIFTANPNRKWFVLAMLPLGLYGLIRLWNVAETSALSITSVDYILSGIVLAVSLKFKGIRKLTTMRIFGGCMMLIGTGLVKYPNAGAAAWTNIFFHISGQVMGSLIILCGLLLAIHHSRKTVFLLSSPFLFYLFCVLVYSFNNLGATSGFVAAQLLVCALLINADALDAYSKTSPEVAHVT